MEIPYHYIYFIKTLAIFGISSVCKIGQRLHALFMAKDYGT
jgi:hypothetical protein